MALPFTKTLSLEIRPLGSIEITLIFGVPSYSFVNEISEIVIGALLIVNEKLPLVTPPQPVPINFAFTVYEPGEVGGISI